MYNSDAFWLTQWNLNLLWGLAWPEVLDDFAACLVQYAENGGLLPRGPTIGAYSFIMTGCAATNLITCAYQKGMLTKVSAEKAYKVMDANHKPGGMMGYEMYGTPNEKALQFYIKNGYWPENAGITLEMAFQDWALSQMAAKMGKKKDAAYYLQRSQGWEKLFHPELKLVMPKDADGKWLHEDPLKGAGWVEGTCAQRPAYEITSPIFDKITIHLNPAYYKGKTFEIKTYNNSKENCYIRRMQFNGQPHNSLQIEHADFAKGGLLEIWLGENYEFEESTESIMNCKKKIKNPYNVLACFFIYIRYMYIN
jgi:putative alpha-1,2-mannosidase